MRKILLILSVVISCFAVYSQSNDAKIAEAMNCSDWFALDSLYKASPKDSISDFLEVYSRSMIGNRFNRPDISIPAFEELLENHSQNLSLNQLISTAVMCAIDMSRVGDNAKAASVLTSVHERFLKDGNVKAAKILEKYIKQYSSLAEYDAYKINCNGDSCLVPFHTVPIGKPEDNGVHMHLEKSFINGIPADITFDTGAGVNIISESFVEKYDLIPIDIETKVSGARSHNGTFAIAKELKIGNITVCDVPFYVMDITANNAEANQYMQRINIILGSDLMLQLKYLTIDFENRQIIVPAKAPIKTEITPNLCFSSGMNLLAKGTILDTELLMNIDTGDSGYGSIGKNFYKKNKKFINSKGTPETFRKAGIGGIEKSKGYKVSDMPLYLGGNSVTLPSLNVMKNTDCFGYECNLGLKSLMLYKTVRFNLVDFVLSTVSYE